MSIHFADPKPGACSACFNSGEGRYIDFDAAYDGAVVIDPESGTPHVWPDGQPSTNDDLYLCEACVRSAAELLAFKPELHSRQIREIKRLELERDHWRDHSKRIEATLKDRPEPPPSARRKQKVGV